MPMENDMYNDPLEDITHHHHHHLTQKPLIHCYSFDLNNQNHIINGIPILSEEQVQPITNAQVDGSFMNILGNASNPIINSDFQVASLPARFGLQENLENSAPSMEALGSYLFNNWHDTSTFGDNVYQVPSNLNLSCSSIANLEPNGWQTSSNVANLGNLGYSSSNCSNELSLSLATSPNTGQCSEISSSSNCSNMELSMCLGSHKHVKFSPAILGSRYLSGIQEILVQISKFSFENLDEVNNHSSVGGNKSSSAFGLMRRFAINQDANSMSEEVNVDSPLQRHVSQSKKSQLLMLLQMVDNQYSHCLDEIHTVVSAFHAATELDPQIHAHFALQTVSLLYKDLRERISNYILSMGSNFNSSWSAEEKECSVETSFIQKQWALQQLKRKDQLWRPQRGLPERSVSVLRDWMFQNFLHPYPKDAEKHLLAVKSGLTRSQVSNWFINARVRLWKPLIDEMYGEMNRRKEMSHRSMNNQMFNIN